MPAGPSHGVTDPRKSRRPERSKPALARNEPTYIPPASKKSKKGVERPRGPSIVSVRCAFAKNEHASRAQHIEQVAQCSALVLGAMHRVDRKNGIEISP